MKRKILSIAILLALLLSVVASAASLDKALIDNAKQAVSLMSYGEYKKALKKLSFSKNAPSASDLSDFASESLGDLAHVSVQSTVGVAYQMEDGGAWRIAIPIEEPSYDTVQTFVLRSKNGKSFDGYKAMSWYEVEAEIADAASVIWRDAYDGGGDYYLVADE